MATLRELIESMGGADVKTLLQSGNAVFDHAGADVAALADELTARITEEAGLSVPCVVREITDLRRTVRDNPFSDIDFDPAQLIVIFLSGPLDPERIKDIDPDRFTPDEFRLGEREIYAYCPTGLGRSRLPTALGNKRLGPIATARNWNTVTKLALMADN